MDNTEFNERWEELRKGKEFHRMQGAHHLLSILSYHWSEMPGNNEQGKKIWEGSGCATHDITTLIMEHVPSQDQQRAFGIIADIIEYTFVISAHEKGRKEAKDYIKKVIKPAHAGARMKGDKSKEITRRVAKQKRGPNGEALTPGQLLKHVQAERAKLGMKPLGKSRDGKEKGDDSAIKAISRHLDGYDY